MTKLNKIARHLIMTQECHLSLIEHREELEKIGHGSIFSPGATFGYWRVDEDNWWVRQASAKDQPLVRNSNDGFIENGRVYVRSKALAQRLDRGLKL